MLRVVAALLLTAAALAAVDLTGLVDEVYNTTLPLERFAPTYVFEVDGCRVLVYVADPTLKNSPLTDPQTLGPVYYPRNKELKPLTSAEVEKLLDALFQALGPSAEAVVTIVTKDAEEDRDLHVEAKNATQLAEEARRALRVDFYLGVADVQKTLERGAEPAAYLHLVAWRHRDIGAVFRQSRSSARLVVVTTNLSAAVEALEKAREAAGEVWNSVEVVLWYGPYFVPGGATFGEALRNAVLRLEKELGTVREIKDEKRRVRRVEGTIHFLVGDVGPLYVIFPYPNGTAPDRATAERIVRRFVELSGFCKSPLVVEFWPKTGYELYEAPFYETPHWPYAATIGVAVAMAVGLLVFARRRR